MSHAIAVTSSEAKLVQQSKVDYAHSKARAAAARAERLAGVSKGVVRFIVSRSGLEADRLEVVSIRRTFGYQFVVVVRHIGTGRKVRVATKGMYGDHDYRPRY